MRSGTTEPPRDAVEWAREAEARGAGEILLTSMDRDGTKAGFDCEMTAAVSSTPSTSRSSRRAAPARFDHFADVFTDGRADAALAASIFHFTEHSVEALKDFLHERGFRCDAHPALCTQHSESHPALGTWLP